MRRAMDVIVNAVLRDETRLMQAATALRLLLLAWGSFQDAHLEVPYTDIDYVVFTDAARFMARGASPYERDTYRYSPLIAAALIPNVLVHESWGKCVFAAGDLLAGWLITRVLRLMGVGPRDALACTAVWLFNPFTVTISTRGSCESFVSTLMLTVVYSLMRGALVPAAVVYGLATHLRIYPIVYALPLVMCIGAGGGGAGSGSDCGAEAEGRGDEGGGRSSAFIRCLVTTNTVLFGIISGGTFLALGGACYVAYGDDFLNEAFLFHLSRTDIRHNFSPSFYGAYLSLYGGSGGGGDKDSYWTSSLGVITGEEGSTATSSVIMRMMRKVLFSSLLPQFSVVLAVGVRYAQRHLPFCLFLQTLGFVAFNKVCTAQYFVWYFCLLPLALPDVLRLSRKTNSAADEDKDIVLQDIVEGEGEEEEKPGIIGGGQTGGERGEGGGGVANGGARRGSDSESGHGLGRLRAAGAAWLLAQVHWLAWAYGLEFLGYGVFLPVWFAGVVFTGANAWLMVELMRAQQQQQQQQSSKSSKSRMHINMKED